MATVLFATNETEMTKDTAACTPVFHEINDNNFTEYQSLLLFRPDTVIIEHLLNGYYYHYAQPCSRYGVWATFWVEAEPVWAQGLVGILRRIDLHKGIMEVGLGTGIEAREGSKPVFRISSIMTYESYNERFTALSTFEYGIGSDFWYMTNLNYHPFRKTMWFAVGIQLQRNSTSGGRLNFHIGKHITTWVACGVDLEDLYGQHTSSTEEPAEEVSLVDSKVVQPALTFGLRYNFIKAHLK